MEKPKVRNIGLFGGTFDPIHFGHLGMAISLMEQASLSEVWFIPANQNPHKKDQPHTSASDRIQMIELAISEIPEFSVKTLECERTGPSYTIDTIKTLHTELSKGSEKIQLYLLLGEDNARGFQNWKEPLEIINYAKLLIALRKCEREENDFEGNPEVKKALLEGMVATPAWGVSATEIRQRLQEGRHCGHLVPGKVLDYIYRNGLY